MFVSIIRSVCCLVSGRIGVVKVSPGAKPNSRVTAAAVIVFVPDETDPCFRIWTWSTYSVEPFFVTVELQRGLWTNQRLPLLTTQWGVAVLPSAISEYSELACLSISMKLICWPIFIPRQILEKDVFQYVGNLVSCKSNPVLPPSRL